jgi:hypothetical protein
MLYCKTKNAVCRFRSFTQVDFLSIQSYTFERPPRLLLIHECTRYDTKLTFINVIVLLVNLTFSWFKILKGIRAHGRVIRILILLSKGIRQKCEVLI